MARYILKRKTFGIGETIKNAVSSVKNTGANSIGQIKNTWNKMGTAGKVGTAAAGIAAAGLITKGLFGGSKKEE